MTAPTKFSEAHLNDLREVLFNSKVTRENYRAERKQADVNSLDYIEYELERLDKTIAECEELIEYGETQIALAD